MPEDDRNSEISVAVSFSLDRVLIYWDNQLAKNLYVDSASARKLAALLLNAADTLESHYEAPN